MQNIFTLILNMHIYRIKSDLQSQKNRLLTFLYDTRVAARSAKKLQNLHR